MAGFDQQTKNLFDFSQDAQDFKARLWKRIQASVPAAAAQELDDDDLEWVNAAGMQIHRKKDGLPD